MCYIIIGDNMKKDDLISFYDEILNIGKENIDDKVIVEKISKKYIELSDNNEGLCKVISSNVSADLNDEGILNCIINTKKIGSPFEHEFVIAKKKKNPREYWLIDPAFKQFEFSKETLLNKKIKELPIYVLAKTESGKKISANLLTGGVVSASDYELKQYIDAFNTEYNIDIAELITESLKR